MCGMTSPMKPTTPHTATVTPTIAAATANIHVRNRFTFRPREPALSSPASRILRFEACARHRIIPIARTPEGNKKFSHLAAPKPPRLQNNTCEANCGSGDVSTIKLLTADSRAETAVPVSIKVPAVMVCRWRATMITRRSVKNAPPNAANPSDTVPPMSNPNRITAMAPVAAPDEAPRIVGLARGLRKSACTVVPTVVNAIPATAARSTRGRRVSATIRSIAGVHSTDITPSGNTR